MQIRTFQMGRATAKVFALAALLLIGALVFSEINRLDPNFSIPWPSFWAATAMVAVGQLAWIIYLLRMKKVVLAIIILLVGEARAEEELGISGNDLLEFCQMGEPGLELCIEGVLPCVIPKDLLFSSLPTSQSSISETIPKSARLTHHQSSLCSLSTSSLATLTKRPTANPGTV
jgi:hypothetical protein